jgi:hypothetical protein
MGAIGSSDEPSSAVEPPLAADEPPFLAGVAPLRPPGLRVHLRAWSSVLEPNSGEIRRLRLTPSAPAAPIGSPGGKIPS